MECGSKLRIILIGASREEAATIAITLKRGGALVSLSHAHDSREFEGYISRNEYDLALWCEDYAGFSLALALEIRSRLGRDFPLIVLQNQISEVDRAHALLVGASDAVLISNRDHLALVVHRELSTLSNYRKKRDLERRYAESQKNYFDMIQTSRNAVAFVANGYHVHANPIYRRMFGYSYITEFRGLPLADLLHGADARKIENFLLELKHSGGTGEINLTAVGSGGYCFGVTLECAQARFHGKDTYRIIAKPVNTTHSTGYPAPNQLDALTNLMTHQYFLKSLEDGIESSRQKGDTGALLLVELEHLRSIRARLGIAGCDLITRDLAAVIQRRTNSTHVLGRFADHTFTLYLPKTDMAQASALTEQIRTDVEMHICDAPGQSVSVSCSIGIVEINGFTLDEKAVVAHADIACRSAIRAGGNAVRIYEPASFEPIRPIAIDGL